MKTIILILALSLQGCITVSHTLKDGTRIYASPAGIGGTTADGKTTIDLPLPRK
jgi:hypothetical protein